MLLLAESPKRETMEAITQDGVSEKENEVEETNDITGDETFNYLCRTSPLQMEVSKLCYITVQRRAKL